MKLVYIGVFKNDTKDAIELTGAENLKSINRWVQKGVKEGIVFASAVVAKRTPPHKMTDVLENGHKFHALASADPICAVVVTDDEYPSSAAHRIVRKVLDEFSAKYPRSAYSGFTADAAKLSYPELKEYVEKYQDPETVDATIKIQRELDETKVVLHKTLESVLERGEKLDDLVQKSEGLSAQSKMFYTQAKKQNSCCTVM
ncbi:hypothetical protein COCC4DRAFT_34830 [Bipolaris maydis ATCC 48331]|uniref:Synaptobrevin homolog YKT6 n=2 Tax=Cochliobolus heterostrophus TaxID=5016 RepID=M2UBX7_COCH5|nr:uncharacterized protein COCC4DRAFT_34830 [Bipolaris maydis ATCC 48331]EMD85412.1 hypothetical protein COCHEDRAFT_1207896 [Bipolaris maydis C5]KAH7548809.1 hypothetical protein BM1_10834 [Bipolaris maydis]ENH99420.1 hypothetical protein COCC4DRAFT_34830 [Bipolaris maydis ATCC 48331]KAJ5024630.1 Longin-like domain-containing protein [Bipolaris maydis]KAJ5056833.1 Longin-like domain-containing protein [Bipolaris maydis]